MLTTAQHILNASDLLTIWHKLSCWMHLRGRGKMRAEMCALCALCAGIMQALQTQKLVLGDFRRQERDTKRRSHFWTAATSTRAVQAQQRSCIHGPADGVSVAPIVHAHVGAHHWPLNEHHQHQVLLNEQHRPLVTCAQSIIMLHVSESGTQRPSSTPRMLQPTQCDNPQPQCHSRPSTPNPKHEPKSRNMTSTLQHCPLPPDVTPAPDAKRY